MTAVQELEAIRERMRQKMPFGEPAIALNPDYIRVSVKDPLNLHIRMEHLIEIVREITAP